MPNLLTVAMVETILSLHQRGWSQRRIAHELGIDRETVARYLKRNAADSKPAIAPLGSNTVEADPKPANAPLGSETPGHGGRVSECEPFRNAIRAKLDRDLSAQRIFQDLVAEHGFTGSY